MNQMTPAPKLEIIPPSAPFSEQQRSWLNGFFAGLLTSEGAAPLSPGQGASLLGGAAEEDDSAPWHDPTMPLP
ncbi:MAG: sulfite reductase subunit alpha, partial [Tardiphaga sp.]|nr:sulfite reductase subunit alpha [Tardiphaga sp.]